MSKEVKRWIVTVAVFLVPAVLAGCDDTDSPGSHRAHNQHKPRKKDPQCGFYYYRSSYRYQDTMSYDQCGSEIERYCEYGAVSRAQLAKCMHDVTWGEFKHLNTNAAEYARLGLTKCLSDSGPFCRPIELDYGQ